MNRWPFERENNLSSDYNKELPGPKTAELKR